MKDEQLDAWVHQNLDALNRLVDKFLDNTNSSFSRLIITQLSQQKYTKTVPRFLSSLMWAVYKEGLDRNMDLEEAFNYVFKKSNEMYAKGEMNIVGKKNIARAEKAIKWELEHLPKEAKDKIHHE